MRRARLASQVCTALAVLLSLSAAQAAQHQVYLGGKVVNPTIDRFYWGTFTQAEINAHEAFLGNLASYMSDDGMPPGSEPTIRQYGVSGAALGKIYVENTTFTQICQKYSCTNGRVNESGLIQKLTELRGGTSPKLSPARDPSLVAVFTEAVSVQLDTTGKGACGFHDSASGAGAFTYSPFNIGCVSTDFRGIVMNATQTFQNSTSHEIFEASVDYNPRVSPNGWLDVGGAEVADNCPPDSQFNWVDGSTGSIAQIWDNNLNICSSFTGEEDLPAAALLRSDQTTFDVFSRIGSGLATTAGTNGSWSAPLPLVNFGVVDAPAAVSWFSGGRKSVFYRGSDGSLQHLYYNGSSWSHQSLGGVIVGSPSAVAWKTSSTGPYQVNVFVLGLDGGLYSFWSTDGVSWSAGLVGNPSSAVLLSPPKAFPASTVGSFVVYSVGVNGRLYAITWSGSAWSSFTDLGSHVDVFQAGAVALGSSSFVYQRSNSNSLLMQSTVSGTRSAFRDLQGIIFGTPSAVELPGCMPSTYVRGAGGASGTLWVNYSLDCGSTNQWAQLDGTLISTAPVAAVWGSNRDHVDVFVREFSTGLINVKTFDGSNWLALQQLPLSVY